MARPPLPLSVVEAIVAVEDRTKLLLQRINPVFFDVNVITLLSSCASEAFRYEAEYYRSLAVGERKIRRWLKDAASDRALAATMLLGVDYSAPKEEWHKALLKVRKALDHTETTRAEKRTKEGRHLIADRAALLDAYKDEGRKKGIRITDLMVAEAASRTWHDRTPVQRWKRGDPRCTAADDAKIREVLRRKPRLPR